MSAPPAIPPRPSRVQNQPNQPNQQTAGGTMDVPKIPPRPKRSVDRSVSPGRDRFAPSPLNDPAFLHNGPQHRESRLSVELPPRPPSVTLPSLGQEGSEYASFEDLSKTLTNEREGSPQQTKNVGDLPLHAPRASVPSSTAKSRIQTVTRTDSSQAAAAGVGKLVPDDRSTQGTDSARPGSSAGGNTRPSSVYKEDVEEQGIPEIGVQVPMYPNAGDVQAPTPQPHEQGGATGVGYFNKGDRPTPRHHGRTKSGREIFHAPPGSYGRHGHGVIPKDDFEKSWYDKHPEDLKREKAGEYGPHIQENRKDYHWGGDDLNKLVHQAVSKGAGIGTSPDAVGTPDEQIGYIASEEFASRMASPRPSSGRPASISGKSGYNVESPLRQTAFPADQLARQQTHENEAGDDVIHVDPPSHRSNKIKGDGYEAPTEDLGPEGGNTEENGGWVSERGYGVPILASDEIQKHPGAEHRQPAVSPELERRGSGEYTVNEDGTRAYKRSHSRSSSRNNHSQHQQRVIPSPYGDYDRNGTPLESHKEYEPLFPEDEKPKTASDKLKRPELARHQFPSQDTWEDTPSSLQLETTVETPQAPEEPPTPADAPPAKAFEDPATEEARKNDITQEDQKSFLPENTKRFVNKNVQKEHLDQPTRPGMQQRFPSQDIWEDAPEHGHLETTVSAPQTEDTNEYADDSPVVEKPNVPTRPSVPARPQKKQDESPVEKKAPMLPERPKPQVPARPSKPVTQSSEVPTLESQAGEEASQPKAKPAVPARPAGSKIAALQAGFLKDLNSKLGLGPQAPKVKEPEPEKEDEPPKPLQDARKGRAKGPQRRKPTSSPSPAAATVVAEVAVPQLKLELAPVTAIWSIGDDGEVDVPAAKLAARLQASFKTPGTLKIPEPSQEAAQELEPATTVEAEDKSEPREAETEPAKPEINESEHATPKTEPEMELDATGGVPLEAKTSVDQPLSTVDLKATDLSEVDNAAEEVKKADTTEVTEPVATTQAAV